MEIIGKKLSDFSKVDIDRLIENLVPESVKLEYKSDFNLSTESDKKEFLADVTAFTNTEGGVIIYGIEEKKDNKNNGMGIPNSVKPITVENEDKLKQQIENLLKDGLDPSLTTLEIKLIPINSGKVMLLGIPKNFGLPRMVKLSASNRFYKRRNTGKYLLDVYELNTSFLRVSSMYKEYDQIHRDRLEQIQDGKFIPNLEASKIFVLHSFPIDLPLKPISFTDKNLIQFIRDTVLPIHSTGYTFRHNLEGFLVANWEKTETSNNVTSYVQLNRNGLIEFFTVKLTDRIPGYNEDIHLYGHSTEKAIEQCLNSCIDIYKFLEITLEFYVKISITGLQKSCIINEKALYNRDGFIGRELLEFPGFLITNENLEESLKDIKDTLWQCGGYLKSPWQ